MSNRILTAVAVDKLFKLIGDGAESDPIVDGIVHKFRFNLAKIEEHRDSIIELLREVHPAFLSTEGGGMSFLRLCEDKHGNLWTGLQVQMEILVAIGMSAGYVKFCVEDREIWKSLPGGVPYIVVTLPDEQSEGPEVRVVDDVTTDAGTKVIFNDASHVVVKEVNTIGVLPPYWRKVSGNFTQNQIAAIETWSHLNVE